MAPEGRAMTETRKLAAILVADVLANLVRLEEAQSEAKAGLALDPGFSIRRFSSGGQAGERLLDSMRKAAVPEG
jgi:hypothetical protein